MNYVSRRLTATVGVVLFCLAGLSRAAETGAAVTAPLEKSQHVPETLVSDGTLHLTFGDERVILPRGLQPSLLCTRDNTLVVQAQVSPLQSRLSVHKADPALARFLLKRT